MALKFLDEAGLSYFWSKLKALLAGKVSKTGDTMTGKLTLVSDQYTDNYTTGALDLKNSNIQGVNSIYTADASDDAAEGIHFYRDSTHVDSVHAKSGSLYFTPNRQLGSSGTSKKVLLEDSAFYEANLAWGGKNFSASYGCIDAAMIPDLGANRFAFLKAAGLEIGYSTDNGSTWTDYGATDSQKVGLFAKGQGFYLGKASVKANNTVNNQLRVTITTNSAGLYTVLNKIAIYMSTSGNTVSVKIEKATKGNPTTYTTHLDWTGISGWSGWNILNISGLTTYGNTDSQYQKVRFTFKQTAINSNYCSASISRIMGFGGVGWTVPSNMAATGHLYNYDSDQNATFPAKVTATGGFSGDITGNVTGNVSGTSANVTGTVAVANGGTGKTTGKDAANYFMNALDTGSSTPADNDYYISQYVNGGSTTTTYHRRPMSALWEYVNSKISSVLGLTASSYSGSAAKVNNHTVASDVPANAVFTDTVTTATTSGSGNAVTAISASNGALTVTKGTTFLTQHQDISGKANVTAVAASASISNTDLITYKNSSGTALFTLQLPSYMLKTDMVAATDSEIDTILAS